MNLWPLFLHIGAVLHLIICLASLWRALHPTGGLPSIEDATLSPDLWRDNESTPEREGPEVQSSNTDLTRTQRNEMQPNDEPRRQDSTFTPTEESFFSAAAAAVVEWCDDEITVKVER